MIGLNCNKNKMKIAITQRLAKTLAGVAHAGRRRGSLSILVSAISLPISVKCGEFTQFVTKV